MFHIIGLQANGPMAAFTGAVIKLMGTRVTLIARLHRQKVQILISSRSLRDHTTPTNTSMSDFPSVLLYNASTQPNMTALRRPCLTFE